MHKTQSPRLDGVAILDVSHVLVAPFCTKISAQLGAFTDGKSLYFSVIKRRRAF